MEFQFDASFTFHANDIDDAVAQLALHFLNLGNKYISDPLQITGRMELQPVPKDSIKES